MRCHFYGRMDHEPLSGMAATLEIVITETNRPDEGSAVATASSDAVDPGAKIALKAILLRGFEPLVPLEVELEPPRSGELRNHVFVLRPLAAGDGELLVLVNQGSTTLAALQLKRQIVASRPGGGGPLVVSHRAEEARPRGQRVPHLRIIQQDRPGETYFQYLLDLTGLPGGGELFVESDRFKKPIEKYVEGIYAEIEGRWLETDGDYKRFVRELRDYGGELFDELIPTAMQDLLWKRRNDITSIMVRSTEPSVPWELVHVKKPGAGLPSATKFLGQMGLVRWPVSRPNAPRPEPLEQLRVRRGRARYVIPRYDEQNTGIRKLPEAEAEAEFLEKKLGAKPVQPEYDQVTALLEQQGAFDLLHFACHGEGDREDVLAGRLLLQGGHWDDSQPSRFVPDVLTATAVGQRSKLQGRDGTRPMVVLNACQVGRQSYKLTGIGGFADSFIKRDAGLFVGTLWSVLDEPARMFTEAFYTALLGNKTVSEAATIAREKARGESDATWLAYVVYADPLAKLVTS